MASNALSHVYEDVSVDVPTLMTHPKAALLGVLTLLPGWENAIEDDISVEQFSGAMTNMVYRCGLLGKGGVETQVALMRVHASASDLFDRQAEIATFRGVGREGLGPRLLLLFNNGRVEEFLSQHVTLAAADIHDPAVSAAIASTMATFHCRMSKALSASAHHKGLVQLWERLRAWLELVQHVTTPPELQALGMSGLRKQIDDLEAELSSSHPCWVALCHNDLQYGNIMALAAAAELVGGAAPPDAAAAAAGGDSTPAAAAAPGGDSLAQQLSSLGLGQHNRQQQASPSKALDGASDDAASLSNVSVAGSTAPSVSGLSVLSASGGAPLSPGPATQQQQQAGSKDARLGQLHPSDSQGSLHLTGRSPSRAVQLPDGSLVLPGMKARPRGQSPEPARGKPHARDAPHHASSSGSSRAAAVGDAKAAAAAAASRGDGGAALAVMMQAPSAAAVRRHAADADGREHMLLQLGADDDAEAGLQRRRRASRTAASDDSDSSSSDDGALLMPARFAGAGGQQQSKQGPGGAVRSSSSTASSSTASSSRIAAAVARERPTRGPALGLTGTVLVDPSGGRSKTAHMFQELRKQRMKPAAGMAFPSLTFSDGGSSSGDERGGGGVSSDDSSGLSDDDSPRARTKAAGARYGGRAGGPAAAAPAGESSHARGRSPGHSSHRPPVPPLSPAQAAKAASAKAAAVAASEAPAAEAPGCLTFIDYEYSGFNPIAFDIANHWCEWAADYHTEEPAVLDFSRLPDEQQQRTFVEAYLRALLGRLGVTLPAEAQDGGAGAAPAAGSSSGGAAAASIRQLPPDSSGRRSEAAWSTLSSRGGSVLSMPDTDAAWETASGSSVVTARSARTDGTPHDADGASSDGGSSSLRCGADAKALRDVWAWLELSACSTAGSSGVLDVPAWRRLVAALLSASRAYMAASHLQWALWGVIQGRVSDVEFDFAGYGAQRWQQYLVTRPAPPPAPSNKH